MPERPDKAKARYEARKAKGLCTLCGKISPDEPGRVTCTGCRKKIQGYGRPYRQRRRDARLCTHCGEVPLPGRKMCAACLAYAKGRYQRRKQKGLCVLCGSQPARAGKSSCAACTPKAALRIRSWIRRCKIEVMQAYGGCFCACCGESNLEFLSIDHINGGGRQHLLRLRQEGKNMGLYRWLKAEGYPPGYQVLCMNCNWAKGKFSECPHKREKHQSFTFIA